MTEELETTDDAFLGGALQILQPAKGFRSGLDAVLLAASIPAQQHETALEAGSGVGVASLCLAHRVKGLIVVGLEADAQAMRLARLNAERNGFAAQVMVFHGLVESPPEDLCARSFDHAFANPPFLEEGEGSSSPQALRAGALMGPEGTLAVWIDFCIRRTRPGGTVTIVHRADRLDRILAQFEGRCGNLKVFPLWPKPGVPAKRVLIQGTKGSRAPLQLLPGLVLHNPEGGFTPQAESILRHGEALAMGGRVA